MLVLNMTIWTIFLIAIGVKFEVQVAIVVLTEIHSLDALRK